MNYFLGICIFSAIPTKSSCFNVEVYHMINVLKLTLVKVKLVDVNKKHKKLITLL